MRIIAGTYRGLRLKAPKHGRLRPTSDQLRETLFDVLGPSVQGTQFLDAYAGSGAVGLEAMSRGAAEVVFIEHHRAATEAIRQNLASLGLESGWRVLHGTVERGLERLQNEGARFHFIFLDPPYEEIREYHHVLRQIGRGRLLLPEGLLIAEHSRRVRLEEHYGALRRRRSVRHGDAQLEFYGLSAPGPTGEIEDTARDQGPRERLNSGEL